MKLREKRKGYFKKRTKRKSINLTKTEDKMKKQTLECIEIWRGSFEARIRIEPDLKVYKKSKQKCIMALRYQYIDLSLLFFNL